VVCVPDRSDWHPFNLVAVVQDCAIEASNCRFSQIRPLKVYAPENKSEDAYVHDKGLRKRVNQEFEDQDPQNRKIQNSFRGTRIKIDLIMPILITLVWVILAGYAFIK